MAVITNGIRCKRELPQPNQMLLLLLCIRDNIFVSINIISEYNQRIQSGTMPQPRPLIVFYHIIILRACNLNLNRNFPLEAITILQASG